MAQVSAADSVTQFRRTTSTRALIVRRLEGLFLGEASIPLVLLSAGLPLVGSLWLLLAPERMLSRSMTWDLLFNLSGAWRIHSGHVPHVDFHDPIGPLGFWLTHLGFSMVGPTPQAFLAGQTIFVVFAFAMAMLVAVRRLATVPSLLFVLYAALLVMMPANIGDQPNAYSFAMSYNRWGWSVLTTLCLLLFLPPQKERMAWLDAVIGTVLVIAMFYLKITFAVAALGAVAVALVASPHIRAHWKLWAAALAVIGANILAPYNVAYVQDIRDAIGGGYVRPPLDHVRIVLASKGEYALYGSGLLLLLWMWRCRQVMVEYALFAAVIVGLGTFVVSQSAQEGSIPLGTVIAYLIYDALRRQRWMVQAFRGSESVPLAAILMWPAFCVAAAMITIVGYHVVAQRDTGSLTLEATNLRGLSVPKEEDRTAETLASIGLPYQLLSSSLAHPPRQQISDLVYVESLVEAASLFANDARGTARIMVVDQVNPMPFMLGYPPPRGGNLWMWPDMPPRPADDVFGDVDVVLIPKYSTYSRATLTALETYHQYLTATFPVHEQSRSWTILSRATASRTAGEP